MPNISTCTIRVFPSKVPFLTVIINSLPPHLDTKYRQHPWLSHFHFSSFFQPLFSSSKIVSSTNLHRTIRKSEIIPSLSLRHRKKEKNEENVQFCENEIKSRQAEVIMMNSIIFDVKIATLTLCFEIKTRQKFLRSFMVGFELGVAGAQCETSAWKV